MILVTGGYGFIGTNLIKTLNDEGRQDIIIVDFPEAAKPEYLEHIHFHEFYDAHKGVEHIRWSDIEQIFHLGGVSSTTEQSIELLNARNVHFTEQLFEKALMYNIPIIIASSASVYGNGAIPNVEHHNHEPLNAYASSKSLMEYCVRELAARNIGKRIPPYYMLRFFNVYGNFEDHKGNQASPVTKFTKEAQETGIIKIFEGSDRITRDFIHVYDVVEIMLRLADRSCLQGSFMQTCSPIFNVGTGVAVSFQRIAELIAEKVGNTVIQTIAFPDHLKTHYQYQTLACLNKLKRKDVIQGGYNFTNIEDYIFQI